MRLVKLPATASAAPREGWQRHHCGPPRWWRGQSDRVSDADTRWRAHRSPPPAAPQPTGRRTPGVPPPRSRRGQRCGSGSSGPWRPDRPLGSPRYLGASQRCSRNRCGRRRRSRARAACGVPHPPRSSRSARSLRGASRRRASASRRRPCDRPPHQIRWSCPSSCASGDHLPQRRVRSRRRSSLARSRP